MKTVTIVVILIGVGAYFFHRFGNPFKTKKAEQPVKSSTPAPSPAPVVEEKIEVVVDEKPAPVKKRAPRKNNTKKSNTTTNTRRGRPSNPNKK